MTGWLTMSCAGVTWLVMVVAALVSVTDALDTEGSGPNSGNSPRIRRLTRWCTGVSSTGCGWSVLGLRSCVGLGIMYPGSSTRKCNGYNNLTTGTSYLQGLIRANLCPKPKELHSSWEKAANARRPLLLLPLLGSSSCTGWAGSCLPAGFMSRSDAVSVPLLTTSALYCALAIPRGIIPPLKRHRPDACDEAVQYFFFFFFFLFTEVWFILAHVLPRHVFF